MPGDYKEGIVDHLEQGEYIMVKGDVVDINDLTEPIYRAEQGAYAKGGSLGKSNIAYIDAIGSFGTDDDSWDLVTDILKKHNIEVNNNKDWHTKGYAEELYEDRDGKPIFTIKLNMNDSPHPKKLQKEISNLPSRINYQFSNDYAKGGKTKVKYDYIPKEAIDELSYTMDKVSKRVSGSNVLSGAYVKSASKVKAKTKSASKVKAKTKGSSDLTAKILAMMTDGEGNKKVILSKDVKEMQKYVSDKLITAFYLGLPKAYDFKGDYSYSGGLEYYEEDYAKKIVVDALKNIKANKFEMGLKYPQYDFEKLLGKPIIKDVEGKAINWGNSTRTSRYRLWIWKDCVIGQTIGVTDSKDGYYSYGNEPTLMGGYKSVQTSKASKLDSIAKFMAKDKDGYVKDNDVLYNGLGGANFDALDKNKIKYAKGGMTEHGLEIGDKIVSEKDKEVLVYGGDKKFSKVNLDKGIRANFAKGGETNFIQQVVDSPDFRKGAFTKRGVY